MTPFSQKKAWGMSSAGVPLSPTTWPLELMAVAALKTPPKVPRSVMRPLVQRKAWVSPDAFSLWPTIWPWALMPNAPLKDPPRVPNSVTAPRSQMTARTSTRVLLPSTVTLLPR